MTMRNEAAARPTQRARKIALRVLIPCILLAMPFVQSSLGSAGFRQGVETIGQLLILAGILGRAWCTMHIGGQKFTELVTVGPFSISRNPLYVFSLIATFGAGLQTASFLFAIVATAGVWFIIDTTVRKEEAALSARFNEAYAAYCAQTPRYIPRFSSWRGVDALTVSMPLFYKTLLDGSLFLLIIPAAQFIHWLQAAGYAPVLLRLPI